MNRLRRSSWRTSDDSIFRTEVLGFRVWGSGTWALHLGFRV